MSWRFLCAGLATAGVLLAGAGCSCNRGCRTSCCAPAPTVASASPCCGDAAGVGAPVPAQAYSSPAPYLGH